MTLREPGPATTREQGLRSTPLTLNPVTVRWSLPRAPGSRMLARQVLWEALCGFPEETVQAAQLMLSELVTNVLMHARTAMELEVAVVAGSVRVTLEDSCPELPQSTSSDVTGGLGLSIVESLSTTWGWDRTAFGKRVWFELDARHRLVR